MHVALVALALVAAAPEDRGLRANGIPIGKGTTQPVVKLTSPSGGWSVSRMLLVAGTVSDSTIDPITLSINGDRYLLRTLGGRFSRKFPAAAGKNVIVATATNRAGSGEARVTCYGQLPAVPLKVVLTSDTDGVYTDLHIYEPTNASLRPDGNLVLKDMAHVYWSNTASPSGGTFFLNEQGGDFDQPGYGPYLYIHRAPPRGVFLIATNYWPSGDKAHTVATLNLTLFEGTAAEVKRRVEVPLATPGSTRVLAWVNILGDGRADVYVPGQDVLGPGWPANLESVARELSQGTGANTPGE
ncbi:MAG TPA: histidine kinase [Anaeromyxobacteraceae bacterium]|nr:histidine kinase [Anaeromyxobacteraceae bacterium]